MLLAAAIAAAAPAFADGIATHGADWVRIMAKTCDNPQVSAAITAGGGDPHAFLAAAAHIGGQDFAACWQPMGNGVLLVYSDGDHGMLPAEAFKPVPEA
jgi:hypothetical protein